MHLYNLQFSGALEEGDFGMLLKAFAALNLHMMCYSDLI